MARFTTSESLRDVAGQARLECPVCGERLLDMMFGRADKKMFCKFSCHSCRTQCVAHKHDYSSSTAANDSGWKAVNRSEFVREVYEYMRKNSDKKEVLVWNESEGQ